jgi:PITH domain
MSQVFRAWERRKETGPGTFIQSDEYDRELLLYVPFTGSVKIRALVLLGGGGGSSPTHVKLFANKEEMDFSDAADTSPLQEIDLVEDSDGSVEYPLKPAAKFASVRSLTFYFDDDGMDGVEDIASRINFIGLKGDFDKRHDRREAVIAVYESRAQQQDHETPAEDPQSSNLGH